MPAEAKDTAVYLGIGSNMGDREAQIEAALAAVERLPVTKLLRKSPLYESKAWGVTDQPDYLNMVMELETRLDPQTLLRHCKSIEEAQGRVDGEKWGPRPIDIDILLFGSRNIRTPSLVVPHLHMWDRRFVLQPLADLEPDLPTPDGATLRKLLQKEKITSQEVKPYEPARKPEDENEAK